MYNELLLDSKEHSKLNQRDNNIQDVHILNMFLQIIAFFISLRNKVSTSMETCYGPDCKTGSFSSPFWPSSYSNNLQIIYLLFVPGARNISFTFVYPFNIQVGYDSLYLGPGLEYGGNGGDFLGRDIPERQVYFFEGTSLPDPITLIDTDSAWLYFTTDGAISGHGFKVVWTVIGECRVFL